MRRNDMEFYRKLDSQCSSNRRRWIPNSSYPRESPSYREEYHHSFPSSQRDPYSSWDDDSYGYSHQPLAPFPSQGHHYSDRSFHSSTPSDHYPAYDCCRQSPSADSYHYQESFDYWEDPAYGYSSPMRHLDPSSSHHPANPQIMDEALPQPTIDWDAFSLEEIEAIKTLLLEAKDACRGQVELGGRRASETTQKRPPPPPPTPIQASPPPAATPPELILTPLAAPPPELILTPPTAPPPELILTPPTAPPPELILTAPTAPPPERPPILPSMTFSLAPEQTSARLSVSQPFFYLSCCHSVIKVILAPPLRALQMVQPLTVRLPLPVTDCHENIADEMPRRRLWDPGGQEEDKILFNLEDKVELRVGQCYDRLPPLFKGPTLSCKGDRRMTFSKLEKVATVQKKLLVKDQDATKRLSASSSTLEASSASARSGRKTQPLVLQPKKSMESSTASLSTMTESVAEPVLIKLPPDENPTLTKRSASRSLKLPQSSTTKSESQSIAASNISNNSAQPSNAISRPSSASLIPAASKTARPIASKAQKLPQLLQSVSASCRLGTDSSPAPSCVPQSYRNAIFGKPSMGISHTSSNQFSTSYTCTSMLPPQSGARKEHQMNFRPSFTFGSVKLDALPNNQEWREDGLHQTSTSSNLTNDIKRLEICTDQLRGSQPNGDLVDDFPHLDIINELLDEEQCILGRAASNSNLHYPQHHLHPLLSCQYSFPGDMVSSDLSLMCNTSGRYDHAKQYFDDSFQSMYPQIDLSASYAIGQMHSVVQIHCPPYGHTDVIITDGYSYPFSDHIDLGRGANGYSMHPL